MNQRSPQPKFWPLALALLLLGTSRPARANLLEDLGCAIVTTVWTLPFTIVDLGFTGSVIYQAASGQPDRGVAVAEIVLMVPQMVVSPIVLGIALHERTKNNCILGGLSLTLVASGLLFAHGVWTLSQPEMLPLPPAMTGAALTPRLNVSPYVSASGSFGVALSRRF